VKRIAIAATTDVQRKLDVRASAALQALAHATPAQIDAYLTQNMTTLAEARQIVKALAIAVGFLLRDEG